MTLDSLYNLIEAAKLAGLSYIFIDKTAENMKLMDGVRSSVYQKVIGQGEHARIKISW